MFYLFPVQASDIRSSPLQLITLEILMLFRNRPNNLLKLNRSCRILGFAFGYDKHISCTDGNVEKFGYKGSY